MARSTRAAKLETRTARLKLAVAKKPVFIKIGPGLALGYRRNQTAGTWVARVADGKGGNWTKAIAEADDFEDSDGNQILDFWRAQERARGLARGSRSGASDDGKLLGVGNALDRYEADLRTRGGDTGNVVRVKAHLSEALAKKCVALLTSSDLRQWRNALSKKVAPATVNRTASAFKAALNLAADSDERIVSRRPWEIGLASLPDAEEARNVILPEKDIRAIVREAYSLGPEFGTLVELAAVTGARYSQIARLEIQDLQVDRADPRLMMPSARKGRGQKKILRRPVPVPAELATRLKVSAANRPPNAPLLLKPSGDPWKKSDHCRLFKKTVAAGGLDSSEVTLYALRHSSIVRQILANAPIRVIAAHHDTSTAMIERTYSWHIADHADAIARSGLLDLSVSPPQANVVPITATGP